jgi:beta-N-acetylhexosaminidase
MIMKKKIIICLSIILFVVLTTFLVKNNTTTTKKTGTMKATVLEVNSDYVRVSDQDNVIYTFMGADDESFEVGKNVEIKYSGTLDKNKETQSASIISAAAYTDDGDVPFSLNDNGMFSQFYQMAYNKLKTMSQDEKIGQIFLVRVPSENQISDLQKYYFGGYLLFERDFKDKTKEDVIDMINEYQESANIPLLIATDEEGGDVSRLSSNKNIVQEPFKSPSELYQSGGMDAIREDTIYKSEVLKSLGINVNLAPVVDVATDPDSYMYERTIKESTPVTSQYAKTVIESSKNTGVSYTLKHFPGYGNNADTHTSSTTDNRTYSAIMEDDIPPFRAGIKAGAEAVLVSHNTVPALDKDNPASLSATVHNVLRNELSFTGIIITDDLDMGAITDSNAVIKAILAGNDLIIVTDYESAISKVKDALENGDIGESLIDKMAFRILAWKYYKGLMYDVLK